MATIINRIHSRLRAGTRRFLPFQIRGIMAASNGLPVVETALPDAIVSEKVANGSSNVAKKLHGRAFYESIGSPKFILAPMVDQSEFVSSQSPRHTSLLRLSRLTLNTFRPGACSPALSCPLKPTNPFWHTHLCFMRACFLKLQSSAMRTSNR